MDGGATGGGVKAGAAPAVTRGWILYDGACGICSRWIPFWTPTFTRIGLDVAPLQSDWVVERTGLTPEQLAQDIRLLHADGRIDVGADVYRHVLRRRWWGIPLYLLSLLPGGRQVFDGLYRAIARHRLALSDACGLPSTRHSAPADASQDTSRRGRAP